MVFSCPFLLLLFSFFNFFHSSISVVLFFCFSIISLFTALSLLYVSYFPFLLFILSVFSLFHFFLLFDLCSIVSLSFLFAKLISTSLSSLFSSLCNTRLTYPRSPSVYYLHMHHLCTFSLLFSFQFHFAFLLSSLHPFLRLFFSLITPSISFRFLPPHTSPLHLQPSFAPFYSLLFLVSFRLTGHGSSGGLGTGHHTPSP